MRRRLLTAMLLTAVVALLGFGLPLALSVQRLYRDEALLLLSQRAAEAAVAVPGSFAREADAPELPDFGPELDVALYDVSGQRLQGIGPATADGPVQAALQGAGARQRRGMLVVAIPISESERVVAAVRVSTPPDAVTHRTYRTWAGMTGLAALVLSGAGVLATHRSRRLARPLDQLRDDAVLLGTGGTLEPRPDSGMVEVDAVRTALADADRRLNAALERERALSADLAHQLRTPLTSLRLRLETEGMASSPASPVLGDLLADVDRLERTIDDLLSLARDASGRRPAHALATSLREAGERWGDAAAAAGRALDLVIDAHLPWVDVSAAALRQVLDVLLDNALRHGAGSIGLTAHRVGAGVVVSVTDQGTQALDPQQIFVRRAPTATGSGIGLALARRLAEAEGMRLVLAEPGPRPAFHLILMSAQRAGCTVS